MPQIHGLGCVRLAVRAEGSKVRRTVLTPDICCVVTLPVKYAGFGPAGLGRVQRVGAMLTLFMTDRGVRNFDDAQASDTERYGGLFRHLLSHGIYVAPSQFEAMFVSLAHSDDDIDLTVEAVGELCRDD